MTSLTSVNAAIIILAIPAAWSAIVAVLRFVARQGRPGLGDLSEKLIVGAMLAPVIAGCAVLALPPVASPLGDLPLMPDFMETAVSVATETLRPATKAAPDLAQLVANLLLGVWSLGAVVGLLRLARTHNRLGRIVRDAAPSGHGIYYTNAPVPAFAWSRHKIILPLALRNLPPVQLELVIAHERAHQRRIDPLWFLSLSLIEAVFWFNPFVVRQGRACRMAAELACDAAVAGADEVGRRTYAQTLIAALKLTSGAPLACVPAVGDRDGYRLRIGQIMKPAKAPKSAVWLLAALALFIPVTAAQLALAKGAPAPIAALVPATQPTTPASGFTVPVDAEMTEGFGNRPNPTPEQNSFHAGIDFSAPLGTPVKASADGTVTFAGDQDGYGTTVEIDHANGRKTRYAHLDSFSVKAGDSVTAGQAIGAVGSSGKSTHPHLHFELWQDDQPQDPAPFLGLQ